MAYFPKYSTFFELEKTPEFLGIRTKLYMSKLEETFNISNVFEYFTFGQVVLIYIKKIFDWSKNE